MTSLSWQISGVEPRPANNRQVSAKKKIQPANNEPFKLQKSQK